MKFKVSENNFENPFKMPEILSDQNSKGTFYACSAWRAQADEVSIYMTTLKEFQAKNVS